MPVAVPAAGNMGTALLLFRFGKTSAIQSGRVDQTTRRPPH